MNGRRSALFFPRSVLVTAVILSLAAGSHVIGGGVLPEVPVLVALAVFMLVPVAAFACRPMSFAVLGGLLGAGQVLLHAAFVAFSGSQRCIPTITAGDSHHVKALAVHCGSAVPALSAESSMPVIEAGFLSPMTIAHLIAVVATAWVIARGDEGLEHLRAWLSARIPDVTFGLPAPAGPLQSSPEAPVTARPWRNISPHSQRGPPSNPAAGHVRLPYRVPA